MALNQTKNSFWIVCYNLSYPGPVVLQSAFFFFLFSSFFIFFIFYFTMITIQDKSFSFTMMSVFVSEETGVLEGYPPAQILLCYISFS